MLNKFKSLVSDDLLFTSLLLCGVAISAFGLGRLSAVDVVNLDQLAANDGLRHELKLINNSPITTNNVVSTDSADLNSAGEFVASKSGSRYHFVDCPGAKQIKETNKIYFTSASAAEAAGYSKAANCPGL